MLQQALEENPNDTDRLQKVREIVDFYHGMMRVQHTDPAERIKDAARRGLAGDVREELNEQNGSVHSKVASVRTFVDGVLKPTESVTPEQPEEAHPYAN